MKPEEQNDTIKRLGAFAGMLDDCSAVVVLHVSKDGRFTFHRNGNIYAQLGALRVLERGLTSELVETEWDPDEEVSDDGD